MIWAILTGRSDYLELIINQQPEPLVHYIGAAVMCHKCAQICKELRMNGLIGRYENMSKAYEVFSTP